jgi:thiol-disulfide isomerase/thioredoxin
MRNFLFKENAMSNEDTNLEPTPLEIGSKAPSLKEVYWVKGETLDVGKQLTIVECWATWCGPCLQTIPHLTELQKKYAGKLEIIGITQEDKETVLPFVEQMGNQMDYRVAIAPDSVYDSYMADITGIPHSFLVDANGKLIWHCHPAEIEPILDSYITGKITESKLIELSACKKSYDETMQEISQDGENAKELIKNLFDIAKKMLAIYPDQPQVFQTVVYLASMIGEYDLIESLCKSIKKDFFAPETLANFVSTGLLEFAGNSQVAFAYSIDWIEFALEKKPEDPYFLTVYARLLYLIGLLDKAIEIQKKSSKS